MANREKRRAEGQRGPSEESILRARQLALLENANNAAKQLVKAYPGLTLDQAHRMSAKLYDEVRRAILSECPPEQWKSLSQEDKATVCQRVINALMDKKRVDAFLNGQASRLIN